jgi:glycopeptide antibiotics resistance protein
MIIFKRPLRSVYRHFKHNYSWQVVQDNAKQANIAPFTTISLLMKSKSKRRIEYSMENLLGNLIGFIPMGILLPVLFRKWRSAWKITGITLIISLLFELTQLATALGSFDVDDLLLNTLGGLIGFLVYLLFSPPRRVQPQQ